MPRQSTPPEHIAKRLPPLALLQDTLLAHVKTIGARTHLIRAAWNSASILPPRVDRTYRFGPPTALRGADGGYPFRCCLAPP